jgi:hypothetical protein
MMTDAKIKVLKMRADECRWRMYVLRHEKDLQFFQDRCVSTRR